MITEKYIDDYVREKYSESDYQAWKEHRLFINDKKLNEMCGSKRIVIKIPVGNSKPSKVKQFFKKLFGGCNLKQNDSEMNPCEGFWFPHQSVDMKQSTDLWYPENSNIEIPCGLLEYSKYSTIIKKYIDEVTYKGDNTIIKQCLSSCINYTITYLLDYKYPFYDNSIDLFDANEFTDYLIDMVENLLPSCVEKMKYIDGQAHMLELFCENYAFKIIDKTRKMKNI